MLLPKSKSSIIYQRENAKLPSILPFIQRKFPQIYKLAVKRRFMSLKGLKEKAYYDRTQRGKGKKVIRPIKTPF